MTVSLHCACALALGCLAALLVPSDGVLGKEVQLQQSPEPRVARWFTNINKYIEKLFNNRSKKPQNHKKPSNSTKSPPSSATIHPHLNITNPTTAKHQPTPSTGTTRAPAKPPPLTPGRQVAQSAEASTHILGQAGRRERETLSSGWGRERSTPGPGVFLSSLDPDLQRPGRNLSTHGPL